MNNIYNKVAKLTDKTENKQLIVCLGYNETYHYYSVAFFALLQSKTYEIYKTLHSLILLMRSWKPSLITVDFEPAHIKVIYMYIFT